MFKVSKKAEYALFAVQHLARHTSDGVTSVADLAIAKQVPMELLAKVLQELKRNGVLDAVKGAGGGYRLAKPLSEIRVVDVIGPFEEHLAVAACQDQGGCERRDCSLRTPMAALNRHLLGQLAQITMDVFLAGQPAFTQPMSTPARAHADDHVDCCRELQ